MAAFCLAPKVIAADYTPEVAPAEPTKIPVQQIKIDKKIQKIKKQKKAEASQKNFSSSEVVMDSDYMEYYPEKSEIEAIGNAKIVLTKDNTTLYANRIVFNHDLNNIKAYENVKIINKDTTTTGDFVNFDLSQDNGWMEKPISKNYEIKITAKEGYLYSDRIEEYDGIAKILKNYDLQFGSLSLASLVTPGNPNLGNSFTPKGTEKGIYNIKAKTIYIDSQDEHNVMRLDNADIYMKKIKIASIPTITTVANKEQRLLDTNFPEFGQVSELGMYAGPGFVFNMPRSSTLKLTPIINYGDSKLGIGGLARFRNAKNYTEIAYGSANDVFLVKGSQQLSENIQLDYNQNTLMDEWFLGPRRPRYATQLLFKKSYPMKDLNAVFSQRISAGYYADTNKQLGDGEGRARWQTQIHKPWYSYTNKNKDLSISVGTIAQTSLSLYSTGDNVAMVRFGPILSTAYKNWKQDLIYFQTASAGKSPFVFDQYVYGKSNVVLVENIRLHKYVTLGYLTSLAILEDNIDNDMIQESRILLSLGPEYAKVILGYDTKRQNTMMLFAMQVGTEGSDIKFKKAVIKNPDNLSKKPDPLFDFTKVKYYRDKIFMPPVEASKKPTEFKSAREEANPLQLEPANERIPVIEPMLAPQQWIR